MTRTLLVVPSIAFFTWLGLMAMNYPGGLLGGFGIVVPGVDGFNEIRSVYGGIPLGFATILTLGLLRRELGAGACLAVAAAGFGMAAGRLISLAIDGSMGPYPFVFMLIELVVGVTLSVAVIFPGPGRDAFAIHSLRTQD